MTPCHGRSGAYDLRGRDGERGCGGRSSRANASSWPANQPPFPPVLKSDTRHGQLLAAPPTTDLIGSQIFRPASPQAATAAAAAASLAPARTSTNLWTTFGRLHGGGCSDAQDSTRLKTRQQHVTGLLFRRRAGWMGGCRRLPLFSRLAPLRHRESKASDPTANAVRSRAFSCH